MKAATPSIDDLGREIVAVCREQVEQMRHDVDAGLARLEHAVLQVERRPLLRMPYGIPAGWCIRVDDGVPVLEPVESA